jgi:parallel beta-helix repeat protein
MRFPQLKTLFTGTKKSSPRRNPVRRLRPLFDVLEDRRMLSATLWVDQAGGAPFTTISAAVAAANPGDTIKVAPGTYHESVSVPKTLTILGGQPRIFSEHGPSIVQPLGDNNTTHYFGFDLKANNIVINKFTVQPDPAATFDVDGILTNVLYSGEQILNNTLKNNTIGLYLNSNGLKTTTVSGNTFDSNNFAGNMGSGQGDSIYGDQGLKNAVITCNSFTGDQNAAVILVWGPPPGPAPFSAVSFYSNVQILSNQFTNEAPVIVGDMTNSKIDDNRFTNPTTTGIYVFGALTNSEIACNTMRGNPMSRTGIYLDTFDVSAGGPYLVAHDPIGNVITDSGNKILNNTITGFGRSGIHLDSGSHGNTVQGNTLQNNGLAGDDAAGDDGLTVDNSFSNIIKNNCTSSNFRDGIRLFNSVANTVTGNSANSNKVDGIELEDSDTNTVSCNCASYNSGVGIELDPSNSNNILGNTASRNVKQGIKVVGGSFNIISGNDASYNGLTTTLLYSGIDLVDTNNAVVSCNSANNNGFDGIHLEVSIGTATGNTISNNTTNNNKNHGIALDGANNNTVSGNTSNNNAQDGIFVSADSSGNTISRNNARGNHHFDIEDGSGTATNNTWTQNHFNTKNPAGLH